MKAGEIKTLFIDPSTKTVIAGDAILLEFIKDCGSCEFWKVEFLDNHRIAKFLIKKEDGTNDK